MKSPGSKHITGEFTEAAREFADGQVVIVYARWILVLAGLVLMLWLPASIEQLRIQILFILLLAMGNFYLHAQLLLKRPTVKLVAYLASAADLFLITILIALNGGFQSDLYIFFFPALLALSVAFETRMTFTFGGLAIAGYALLCFLWGVGAHNLNEATAQIVFTRLLMLAAVVFAGNLYRRIEFSRRVSAPDVA